MIRPEKLLLPMQAVLLRELTANPHLMLTVEPHLRPSFFETDFYRWLYAELVGLFKTCHALPTGTALAQQTASLPPAQASLYCEQLGQLLLQPRPQASDQAYVAEWAAMWARDAIFRQSFEAARRAHEAGNCVDAFALYEEGVAQMNKISPRAPSRAFFLDELDSREAQRRLDRDSPNIRVPTGIGRLDQTMGGGLERGRIGLILGRAKAGKSTILRNFAVAAVERGYKVLHLIYEGGRAEVERAYDCLFALVPRYQVKERGLPEASYHMLQGHYRRLSGQLVLRSYTEHTDGFRQTLPGVHSELQELASMGFRPDLIVVDYGDLLRSGERTGSNWEDQALVYQGLKSIANKGYAMWSATQATRPSETESTERPSVLTQAHLAHSVDKARSCDLLASLNVTDAERQARQARLYVEVQRDGVSGVTVNLRVDNDVGSITELPAGERWVHDAEPQERRAPRRGQTRGL